MQISNFFAIPSSCCGLLSNLLVLSSHICNCFRQWAQWRGKRRVWSRWTKRSIKLKKHQRLPPTRYPRLKLLQFSPRAVNPIVILSVSKLLSRFSCLAHLSCTPLLAPSFKFYFQSRWIWTGISLSEGRRGFVSLHLSRTFVKCYIQSRPISAFCHIRRA